MASNTKRKAEAISNSCKETTSAVEKALLAASPFEAQYAPTEKMRAIVVENFPALGKATALRFLEWVQQNPKGVCSLPTGKTPEYFIKWCQVLLKEWDSPASQKEVAAAGLGPKKPDLSGLTFVQIDEFYPISPEQGNSFNWYVNEYYIKGLGFDKSKALLMDCSKIGLGQERQIGITGAPEDHIGDTMDDVWPDGAVDLSLRIREPVNRLERVQQQVLRGVDQWCAEYEAKIRALGGIGFIMGGIGPDGHVAFNCQGCDHHSTTRLDQLNYPSQAAASGDLGGIGVVRKRKVITIGLGTITYNKDCVCILGAAGEAKAKVVASAIESIPHVNYPASCLHSLPNAAFYITRGAAKLLAERQVVTLQKLPAITDQVVENALIDLSIKTRKRLIDLTDKDVASCPKATVVVKRSGQGVRELAEKVKDSLIAKIEKGCTAYENKSFLHTEPHHDDIMLGYLPGVIRNTRVASNKHHFVCGTSGFNSVSNPHMELLLDRVEKFLKSGTWTRLQESGYFNTASEQNTQNRRRDVWKFLDGVAASDNELRDEGAARRLIYNFCDIFKDVAEATPTKLLARVKSLREYFKGQYAGQKDTTEVQILKGSCREFEAECVWGYLGWQLPDISHLRLGFYTADIFAPEPTQSRDVAPIQQLMRDVKPDIVTLALDPEGTGPDTHYKVLQAVTAAVSAHAEETKRQDLLVWGYRNVWFRFHPGDVNTIFPVSLQMIATLNHQFLECFESQREAEFPAYEIQGPFCAMSQKVQVEQYDIIETCLGYQWFHNHPSPLIRATRGLVFMREMPLADLLKESRALRKATENF